MRTMTTPPRKKLVPFIFGRWKKKVKVLLKPMMKTKPERKRIWEDEGEQIREVLPRRTLGSILGISARCGEPRQPCTHVPKGQEHRVEVQEHPKKEEEEAEADQSHANPCGRWERTSGCGRSPWHIPGPFPPTNVLWICLQSLETAFPPAQALGRLSVPQKLL